MKGGFLKRLLDRAEKIDKEQIVDYMKEIAQERDLLVLIFESMIEGMLVIDVDETVVYINQSARDILTLGDGPTIPDLPLVRVVDNPQVLKICRDGMKTDTAILTRECQLEVDGKERFLQVNIIPLANKNKRVGILILFIDVTDQKEQEKKLRETEKLAALTTLTAGMSHEIRNPLNSLSIHLQLLKRQLKKKGIDDPDTEETLSIFSNEIKRLNGVIESFLSAVRPSQPHHRIISLYSLTTDTLKLMEPEFLESKIDVSLHEEGDWPLIKADEAQMKQAMINILRNAIEAIQESKQEEEEPDKNYEIVITMVRNKDEVNLVFADTGHGIDPKNLPHIFEPYFTTKAKGTGLGLMLVERIIREHNGSISAHSQIGKGTEIVISLPVAAEIPKLLEKK